MNIFFLFLACLTFENKFSVDNDGDGFSVYDGDCNDNDSTITVVECTDDDGDGKSEYEGDCDDGNPNINLGAAELDDLTECMLDADDDGFGDSTLREGITPGTDCDDSNPDIKPTQIEICDGVDNNCDDAIDIDAEDSTTWYYDADGDFYGSSLNPIDSCEKPEYYTEAKYDDDSVLIFDCDDGNRFAFPTAGEVCDGVDNDCDGLIDDADEDLLGNATRYKDADGDGFGDSNIFVLSCDPIAGFVQGDDPLTDAYIDCDDGNPAVYPSADEVCDGFDNDCDGLMDDADDGILVDRTWYVDSDDDDYGTLEETLVQCEQPEGYASVGTDCDDERPFVFPGSEEVCDGIDNNCTGGVDEGLTVPWYADDDGDGFGASPQVTAALFACPETPPEGYVENFDDCNDSGILNDNGIAIGLTAFPGADEYCDGIDNDCDTIVDENGAVDGMLLFRDVDNDSYGTSSITKVSCSLEEGYIDNDQDCNDQDASINPEGTETCQDGADEDCDGSNNDTNALLCTVYYQDSDGDYFGNLEVSLCMCEEENDFTSLIATDCDDSNITVNPEATETCQTEFDDNCDGSTNDMFAIGCSLFYKDDDLDGFGTDENQCLCVEEDVFRTDTDGDCDDTTALIHPNKPEICDEDDTDENCDGLADDASAIPLGDDPGAVFWYRDGDSDNFGDNHTFVKQCDAPIGYISVNGDCDDGLSSVNPSKEETCFSNDDEDCSGTNNDDGAIGCATFYADVDGDSYGTNTDSQCLCYVEDVYTSTLSTDCDDELDIVNPGKDEVCDEVDIDENCNDQADEMNAKECDVYFYDADDDGYGIATNARCLCAADGEYRALVGGDCEDDDASYNPDFDNCGLMGDIEGTDAAMQFSSIEGGPYRPYTLYSFGFDYNNDGYEDFVYVHTLYDTNYTEAGGVFLFLGPLESNINLHQTYIADEADLVFTIEAPQSKIRNLYAGNIDNDAFDEIVIYSDVGTFIIDDNLIGTGNLTNNSDGVLTYGVNPIDLGTNMGNYWVIPNFSYPMSPEHTLHGDYNNDGLEDVINTFPSKSIFGISYGTEFERPQFSSMYLFLLNQSFYNLPPTKLEKGDFNADGIDDIIVTVNSQEFEVQKIFYGGQDGLHSSIINQHNTYLNTKKFDITGDGVEELLFTSSVGNSQPCRILNTVTESVIEGDYVNNEHAYPNICQWGDVNGDGYIDVVMIDGLYDCSDLDDCGAFWVWFGTENGIESLLIGDADIVEYYLVHDAVHLYLDDLDENGISEIYTRGRNFSRQYTISENDVINSSGGFPFNYLPNMKICDLDLYNTGNPIFCRFMGEHLYLAGLVSVQADAYLFADLDGIEPLDLVIQHEYTTKIFYNLSNLSEYESFILDIDDRAINNFDISGLDINNDGLTDIQIQNYVDTGHSSNKLILNETNLFISNIGGDREVFSGYFVTQQDLNGDSIDELVYSNENTLTIFNQADGSRVSLYTEISDAQGFFANIKGTEYPELILYPRTYLSDNCYTCGDFVFYEMNDESNEWTSFLSFSYNNHFTEKDVHFQILDLDNDGYDEMYRYDGFQVFRGTSLGPITSSLCSIWYSNHNRTITNSCPEHSVEIDQDEKLDIISTDASFSYSDPFEGILNSVGRVEVQLSSSGSTWQMVGSATETKVGTAVNLADINGDGKLDILIQQDDVRTYLFYGPLNTYVDEEGDIRPARPDDADATFEGRVMQIFDNNNDGYDDLLIGRYLYHGAPNSAVEPPTSPSE